MVLNWVCQLLGKIINMSAFNWIVFDYFCPNCKTHSIIKAQCHVASTFMGDEFGRFCDNEYKLGQKMRWWYQEKIEDNSWMPKDTLKIDSNTVQECCYSKCLKCQVDLYAVIIFKDITPIKVEQIGLESDWPDGYYK